MNPYLVLGVSQAADDKTIRQAYIHALKGASPDTNPIRFRELNQAYEKIKDETCRNQYFLFNTDCPGDSPEDAFIKHVRLQGIPKPLAWDSLKEMLRNCAKP